MFQIKKIAKSAKIKTFKVSVFNLVKMMVKVYGAP